MALSARRENPVRASPGSSAQIWLSAAQLKNSTSAYVSPGCADMKSDLASRRVAKVASHEIASSSPASLAKVSPGPARVGTWEAKVRSVNKTRPT